MDWLLHQLALLYALEQRALRGYLVSSRAAMRQHLTDVFDTTAHDGTWNADDVHFNQRMRRLVLLLDVALNTLLQETQRTMLTYETAAYRLGYYGTAWQMDATNISTLHDDLIQTTLNAPYIDATLAQRLFDTKVWFETMFRRQMTLSQTNGENATQAMRRMNVIMGGTNDKIQGMGLLYRLNAIAMSEFWRAGNIGAHESLLGNRGLLAGKQWHTSELPNVCPRCNKLNGVIVPLDKKFVDTVGHVEVDGPILHPYCNCFLKPATLSGTLNAEPYLKWYARRNLNDADGRAVLA